MFISLFKMYKIDIINRLLSMRDVSKSLENLSPCLCMFISKSLSMLISKNLFLFISKSISMFTIQLSQEFSFLAREKL